MHKKHNRNLALANACSQNHEFHFQGVAGWGRGLTTSARVVEQAPNDGECSPSDDQTLWRPPSSWEPPLGVSSQHKAENGHLYGASVFGRNSMCLTNSPNSSHCPGSPLKLGSPQSAQSECYVYSLGSLGISHNPGSPRQSASVPIVWIVRIAQTAWAVGRVWSP